MRTVIFGAGVLACAGTVAGEGLGAFCMIAQGMGIRGESRHKLGRR
ncbi:MAG: hypothetical protein U9N36_09575 [Euryarchaeota archaeon]|nr:hypothetical protein [Euryarchaeota archaeon]